MSEESRTGPESLLSQFLYSLPDPAVITDLRGSIELVNDDMLQLVGLSREQAVGQPFRSPLWRLQGGLDRLHWVNEARQFGGVSPVECLVTDAQGNHRDISFSITVLEDYGGQP